MMRILALVIFGLIVYALLLVTAMGLYIEEEFVIAAPIVGLGMLGLIWVAMANRRYVRNLRGRCPKCNYDLRGELDKGCSECGWGRAE